MRAASGPDGKGALTLLTQRPDPEGLTVCLLFYSHEPQGVTLPRGCDHEGRTQDPQEGMPDDQSKDNSGNRINRDCTRP